MIEVLIVALLLGVTSSVDQSTLGRAYDYLSRYGYLTVNNSSSKSGSSSSSSSAGDIREAVIAFQTFAGLNKTGFVDRVTFELMQTPRCGVKDRVAEYSVEGSKWNRKEITNFI